MYGSFLHGFYMFFSYLITEILILECLRPSISVQVSKNIFGKINKRGVQISIPGGRGGLEKMSKQGGTFI